MGDPERNHELLATPEQAGELFYLLNHQGAVGCVRTVSSIPDKVAEHMPSVDYPELGVEYNVDFDGGDRGMITFSRREQIAGSKNGVYATHVTYRPLLTNGTEEYYLKRVLTMTEHGLHRVGIELSSLTIRPNLLALSGIQPPDDLDDPSDAESRSARLFQASRVLLDLTQQARERQRRYVQARPLEEASGVETVGWHEAQQVIDFARSIIDPVA